MSKMATYGQRSQAVSAYVSLAGVKGNRCVPLTGFTSNRYLCFPCLNQRPSKYCHGCEMQSCVSCAKAKGNRCLCPFPGSKEFDVFPLPGSQAIDVCVTCHNQTKNGCVRYRDEVKRQLMYVSPKVATSIASIHTFSATLVTFDWFRSDLPLLSPASTHTPATSPIYSLPTLID